MYVRHSPPSQVGSAEGWAPSSFTSSRDNRAAPREQRPEDFMDDDDGLLTEQLQASLPYTPVVSCLPCNKSPVRLTVIVLAGLVFGAPANGTGVVHTHAAVLFKYWVPAPPTHEHSYYKYRFYRYYYCIRVSYLYSLCSSSKVVHTSYNYYCCCYYNSII